MVRPVDPASVVAAEGGAAESSGRSVNGTGHRIAPSLDLDVWLPGQVAGVVTGAAEPLAGRVESLQAERMAKGWGATRSPRTAGSGSGRVVRTSTTPMRAPVGRGPGAGSDRCRAARLPGRGRVLQVARRGRRAGAAAPPGVAAASGRRPTRTPASDGVPVSRTSGQAPEPLADRPSWRSSAPAPDTIGLADGRAVCDADPDVVNPADVVAVEIDDAVVDQVASDVH